jgi:diguanylate cyclase (GGDEF)-like protein
MSTHILIVDDNQEIRNFLVEFLLAKGFQCVSTGSSEEALEIIEDDSIQVVVSDIILPGISGLELATKIKQKHENIDIIIMTGHGREFTYEEAVRKGACDMVVKPFRAEELQLRIERTLSEQRMRVERKINLEELERLAITDDLTKLFNSRHFYQRLKDEINRSRRYQTPLSLLMLDIDYFKDYNDSYGHLEGNKVLQQIGKTIQICLRSMDTAYRYGGEEFTVLLPQTVNTEAVTVAERIKKTVAKLKFYPEDNETTGITISIGVTEYRHGDAPEKFVKRADQAMYMSKENGRDKVTTLVPADESDKQPDP